MSLGVRLSWAVALGAWLVLGSASVRFQRVNP
jgi:hypothetical protein